MSDAKELHYLVKAGSSERICEHNGDAIIFDDVPSANEAARVWADRLRSQVTPILVDEWYADYHHPVIASKTKTQGLRGAAIDAATVLHSLLESGHIEEQAAIRHAEDALADLADAGIHPRGVE